MTDDLDKLEQLLREIPAPNPNKEMKKMHIYNALEEFDKKVANTSQGMGALARLMYALRRVHNPFTGDHAMKKTYIFAGAATLGVLAITVLNTTMLTDVVPIPSKDRAVAVTAPQQQSLPSKPEESTALTPVVEVEQHAKTADMAVAAAAPPAAPVPSMPMAEKKDMAAGALGGLSALSKEQAANRIAMPSDIQPFYYQDEGRDKFEDITPNPVKVVKDEPVSTFSIDVDTSSYSFVRASLNNNALPQKDAVRVEEMINYFPYNYETPKDRAQPFKASVSVFPSPWNKATKLMHIGIKGYQIEQAEKPRANLVFLLDTSGSMNVPNKLPLLQNSLKMLLDMLKPDDSVAIVTYAGSAGTVLSPTPVKDKAKILAALDNLNAGGSTAGAEGIRQAYQLAEQTFDKKGINRVILATDGDFNVGITDPQELKSFIERKRDSGVYLSVLGFGMGNYNDQLMQTLAQNGNGNAAYIDTINEARKALVEEAGSTLFPIAKDVKLQVEFNPAQVSEYRLIGYETRLLKREDFNNDAVDAGEIGAGHAVTAIYEITPVGAPTQVDALRYGQEKPAPVPVVKDQSGEYAFLKIRYKLPGESESKLITTPVDKRVEADTLHAAPQEAKFAASVAAFGQLLRGDNHLSGFTYADTIALAESAKGADPFGYRAEFINLVRIAQNAQAMKPLGQ